MLKIKTRLDSKGTKDKILELFYEQHKKPTEIAEKLNVVNSYVTKIIQKDFRYVSEKELRKIANKEKSKVQKKKYIKNKREEEKREYLSMLVQINKDNEHLSTKRELSDEQYSNWNRSAFDYDKNSSDLVLKSNINAGYAVPKRVSNMVNPNCIKATV